MLSDSEREQMKLKAISSGVCPTERAQPPKTRRAAKHYAKEANVQAANNHFESSNAATKANAAFLEKRRKLLAQRRPNTQATYRDSSASSVDLVLRFGKHKGKTLAEVSKLSGGRSYLEWISVKVEALTDAERDLIVEFICDVRPDPNVQFAQKRRDDFDPNGLPSRTVPPWVAYTS